MEEVGTIKRSDIMDSIFLKEVDEDVSLILKDGNQAEDLKAIFPQFERQILQRVNLYRGWIEINGGMLRWKTGYCAMQEMEKACLRITPITLCFYIGDDCRAEYPFDIIKDIKLECNSAFTKKGQRLVHHIRWE